MDRTPPRASGANRRSALIAMPKEPGPTPPRPPPADEDGAPPGAPKLKRKRALFKGQPRPLGPLGEGDENADVQ